ncbi:MAG: selenide, water dikinase SelD [Myxococcales bacterium]|nr:selenide, water dikinase SelD [Myxococcales bacterium]
MAIVDLFESVTECGCAAKVPAQELSGLLRGVELPADPAVLVGPDTLDDAGIYKLSEEQCLVQTVDFFPPVARRPEDYGRIAAANALSDVYAMGGRPLTALAIVCMPSRLVKDGVLRDITRGAAEKLREAGCTLLGGHSVLDPQAKFGLSVTGLIHPKDVLSNAAARPGDVLVLTKPVGTGVTIMAVRAQLASAEQEAAMNRCMATLNAKAAALARRCGVRCVTDVTGFGLLGHAMQLARASDVALEIGAEGVPLLDGALTFAEEGLLSAAAYTNQDYVAPEVVYDEEVPQPQKDILCDPQTSGGLLICCPPGRLRELVSWAREELATPCGVVGRVVAASGGPRLRVRRRAFSLEEASAS